MKRPAKEWFKRCIKGVEEKGGAYNPNAVCGNLWHNILSEKEKRRIIREERKEKRKRKND